MFDGFENMPPVRAIVAWLDWAVPGFGAGTASREQPNDGSPPGTGCGAGTAEWAAGPTNNARSQGVMMIHLAPSLPRRPTGDRDMQTGCFPIVPECSPRCAPSW